MGKQILKIIGALLLGGFFIIHGATQWYGMRSLEKDLQLKSLEADGVIRSKRASWLDLFCRGATVVVDFTSADGQPQSFSQKICRKSLPVTNSHYTVRYDPDNPKRAVILSFIKYYNRAFEVLVGLAFVCAGLSFLYSANQRGDKAKRDNTDIQ